MAKLTLDFERPIIELEQKIQEMRELSSTNGVDLEEEIQKLEEKLQKLINKTYSNLNRWQRVQLARHPDRPYTLDYLERICEDFIEIHGDRYFGDDKAVVAGFGRIGNYKVMIIGHQKGKNTKDNLYRNFGCANPEGYRKALRVMKLAEKFHKPIITLIDTPGAYPGVGAEERGQAEAIARNLFEMSRIKTPILVVIIGEGASGGALGIGVGDRIIVLENTWYSVISPEGCASILYRDASRADVAAEAMRVTARDLEELGIADEIIPEPDGGAHRNPDKTAEHLKASIIRNLDTICKIPIEDLVQQRIQKYARMGSWGEIK
jgi:acetyl-CoA carboxylase carboxyl transferase subunit alpha